MQAHAGVRGAHPAEPARPESRREGGGAAPGDGCPTDRRGGAPAGGPRAATHHGRRYLWYERMGIAAIVEHVQAWGRVPA